MIEAAEAATELDLLFQRSAAGLLSVAGAEEHFRLKVFIEDIEMDDDA